MKLDIRVICIMVTCCMLLADIGCLIKEIPPFEAYGSIYAFFGIHAILGLLSGLSFGSIINENK